MCRLETSCSPARERLSWTDFGVAKAAHYLEDEEGERVVGKVEYMPPEQATCQITDPRSDVFSLGVVYYEMLTGQNPFLGDSLSQTLTNVISQQVPDPRTLRPDLDPRVAELVAGCVAPQVDDRFSAGELSTALEQHMYGRGYGPTIVTLATYLAELFPDRAFRSFRPDLQATTRILTRMVS